MSDVVALVCVASTSYERYAEQLMESARKFFRPTDPERIVLRILEGVEGWPIGTICRHSILLRHLPRAKFVFLCDADMRFEGTVGPEILPMSYGITAVQHPGFVHRLRAEFSYETSPNSMAYVAPGVGDTYYAGGFIGGERLAMRILSTEIESILMTDARHGIVPVYHDESALNAILARHPPEVTLSPAYVYPDNDQWYRTVWREQYERRLVALDKTATERGNR